MRFLVAELLARASSPDTVVDVQRALIPLELDLLARPASPTLTPAGSHVRTYLCRSPGGGEGGRQRLARTQQQVYARRQPVESPPVVVTSIATVAPAGFSGCELFGQRWSGKRPGCA